MTILTSTAQDAYNQLLADNSNNLKGTWEITKDNYLSITGNSNGSIAMFSSLGALTDFTLEWTSKQLSSGGYITSNLCPVLRYTPEDTGTEGGGDNWALLTYICSYGGKVGTLNTRTKGGVTQENVGNGTLVTNSTYSFKLTRANSSYTLYQDDVIICQAPDPEPDTPLYLGWYLWYGGSNAAYQTNFVLQNYVLDGEIYNFKNYLNKEGLKQVWKNIKNYHETYMNDYYSKEEVDELIDNISIEGGVSVKAIPLSTIEEICV